MGMVASSVRTVSTVSSHGHGHGYKQSAYTMYSVCAYLYGQSLGHFLPIALILTPLIHKRTGHEHTETKSLHAWTQQHNACLC